MCANSTFGNEVVVIGAAGIDDIARPTAQMRAGASNPVQWQRFAGGVAANVARGISRQLCAHLITVIGTDPQGQVLAAKLNEAGVKVAAFNPLNSSTGSYTAVLDEHGELFVGLSDFTSIELLTWRQVEQLLPATLKTDSSSNRVQAIVLDANLSEQCIVETVNQLAVSNTAVFALTVSPAKAIRLLPVASKVDALFCNRAEASALTMLDKGSTLDQFADRLSVLGFNQFVISDGSSTALVQELEPADQNLNKRQNVDVPTLPIGIEALSTVNGAGDAMAAATIAHYLQQTERSLAVSLRDFGMPCLLYTSPSPRDQRGSRMPSSA